MMLVGSSVGADERHVERNVLSIDVQDVRLGDVISELAAMTDTEYVSYADLSVPVSVKLDRAPLSVAVTKLLRRRSFTLIENLPTAHPRNRLWIFGDLDRPVRGNRYDRRAIKREAALERLEAVAALADADGPPSLAALAGSLADEARAVRTEATYALSRSDGVMTVMLLRHALTDADEHVRQAAVESLADIGSDAAFAALSVALEHPDEKVRETAMYRVVDFGGARAGPLLERARYDPVPELREIATNLFNELALD